MCLPVPILRDWILLVPISANRVPFVGGLEPLPYKRDFKMMKFMSPVLAGGFKHFLCSPLIGGMIQFD